MKLTIALAAILLTAINCHAQEQDEKSTIIRSFYSTYITTMEHLPVKRSYSRDSLEKYFTSSFLKSIPKRTEECECDPITQSQDYNGALVSTITIDKVSDNAYEVCFPAYAYNEYCFTVEMKEEGGQWRINNVLTGGE